MQPFASQPHAGHIPRRRPFISVAVPTFGRPDTVRWANDSVLRQDFCDWELVVSDDEGPEGRTWATLSEYARSEPSRPNC